MTAKPNALQTFFNQVKNFRSSITVGMDYGSDCVKILEMQGSSAPFAISHFAIVPAQGAAGDGLGQIVASQNLAKRKVSASIPDEKVEMHEFQFPVLGKSELATALEFELSKSIPSRDFVYFDLLTTKKATGSDVQCVLAPRDLVDQRYDEIAAHGLSPHSLEPESSGILTTVHLFRPEAKELNAAVLDLGYSAFRILFIHGGRVSFTRSLYLGLGSICSQVAAALSVPVAEAVRTLRELKKQDPANTSLSPLQASLERLFQESLYTLCEEFTRSEFFTKDQKQLPPVDEVFLCGGGACLPTVTDYVARHLTDKRVETLDVLKLVEEVPEGMDPTSGPLWAGALGLGVRGGK